MRRQTFEVKVGDETVRHRTVVEDDDSVPGSDDSRTRGRQFLNSMLNDSPEILRCGYHEFQKLTMRHDGQRWVIETEAEVRRPKDA